MTAWHITFGTYGARLHGDEKQTVDRQHNRFGTPYLEYDPERSNEERAAMSVPAIEFTLEQRVFVEAKVPEICVRGKWGYFTCAAEINHVHTLLSADESIHGKHVRKWLKHWLSDELNSRWRAPTRTDGMSWWTDGGSTRAVNDREYFDNVVRYINAQRATPRDTRRGDTPRLAVEGQA